MFAQMSARPQLISYQLSSHSSSLWLYVETTIKNVQKHLGKGHDPEILTNVVLTVCYLDCTHSFLLFFKVETVMSVIANHIEAGRINRRPGKTASDVKCERLCN